jgi:lipopolysaccharide/colanic/teichoic acid biosynthesis glycosyltransferase
MLIKRIFDFVAAAAGLVLLAPLFAVAAVLVKLDSPGPVFFRQQRVGIHGRLFRIFKFRTMVSTRRRRGRSPSGAIRG